MILTFPSPFRNLSNSVNPVEQLPSTVNLGQSIQSVQPVNGSSRSNGASRAGGASGADGASGAEWSFWSSRSGRSGRPANAFGSKGKDFVGSEEIIGTKGNLTLEDDQEITGSAIANRGITVF